jgi:methylenetetrahydrofolate dehydrogenase (NADP+)/methenyltetrahydrofolate cyclohydrolase
MTADIIDGRTYAERVRACVARDVASLRIEHGVQPALAVVLVGEDPASQVYVRSQGEHSLAAGMQSVTCRLPSSVLQRDLLALIAALNDDSLVHGILV